MAGPAYDAASDAYVYFYPIVQNLKTLFYASVWPHSKKYKTPVNQFYHATSLLDWQFTSVVAPNNDTLYSQAWLDLEQQPAIVLRLPTVPTVDGNKRYYSMQIVDGFTYNVRIISPRTTGSWEADAFLILGPSYKGPTDKFAADHIIRCPSRFTLVLGRTGLFGPDDVPNVVNIQKGYTLTPLADFAREDYGGKINTRSDKCNSVSALPMFPFIITDELAKLEPEPEVFFSYANFIMQYISIPEYESDLFKRFHDINIGPGVTFDGQSISRPIYQAIVNGLGVGAVKIDMAPQYEHFGNLKNGWFGAINPPIFGPEEVMKGRYATRAFAAKRGLYGADPQEAMYLAVEGDTDNDALDSTQHNFTLTFAVDEFPPTKDGGFWSITLYRLPERLFVHNKIDRYSIGDRTEGLVYDNGSLTIYIQKDKPEDPTKLANWLPAPDPSYGGYDSGVFSMILRVYWPTEEALSGPYFPEGVKKAEKIVVGSRL